MTCAVRAGDRQARTVPFRWSIHRSHLSWYSDQVWRYVLACQWMRLSQEEPFVGRCGEVGDLDFTGHRTRYIAGP